MKRIVIVIATLLTCAGAVVATSPAQAETTPVPEVARATATAQSWNNVSGTVNNVHCA